MIIRFLLQLGVVLLLVQGFSSHAAATVLISRDDESTPILPAASYWFDASGSIGAEAIVSGAYDANFVPYSDGQLRRRGGDQWLRFEVLNEQQDRTHLVLIYEGSAARELELAYRDSAGLHRYRTGHDIPFSDRPLDSRLMALPLTIPLGERQTVYLKMNLASSLLVKSPYIANELILAKRNRVTNFMPVLIAGVELGVMLSIFVLALGANEWRSVGFYMGMMATSILIVLARDDFFTRWTDGAVYGRRYGVIPIWALGQIFIFLFIRSAYQTRARFPAIDRCCWVMIAIALVSAPLQLWGSTNVLLGYATIFSAVLALTLIAMSLYLVLHRAEHAKLLLGGMSASTVFNLIYALAVARVLPYNLFTASGLDIGSLLLVVTYTLMLSDRLRHYRQENFRLQTSAVVAQAENRAKSELLAVMSHEIRTPMNGVLGVVELLQRTQLDTTQRRYTNIISSSGKTLLTVINDILDFSKAEAGKLSLVKQPFDLSELIEEVVAPYRASSSNEVRLVASLAPETPIHLLGDTIRLQQVIANLLNNAFKFTERGEVRLRIEPLVMTAQRVQLNCLVSDTGIGIDSAQRSRLFQAFSQLDNSSQRRFGGTGLGLTICQRIVHLMDGEIDVDSVPGQGSTFRFTVWIERDPQVRAAPIDAVTLTGKVLLVVDDRAEYLAILQEQAQALGLRVIAVQQPMLAVATARSEHPDIIAIDRDMPGTNGFTLARELAAIPELSAIPRILLTASCDLPGILEIQQRGFTTAFTKPSSTEQLRNILLVSLAEHLSQTDAASTPVRTFSGTRVLVAEDNAINRQVIDAMLQHFGIDNIDNAGDGVEAVELTKRNAYDVIFMDCEMPNMDGYHATRHIREFEHATSRPASAIIALSAHALPEHRQRSLASGMDEHITKPLSIAALEMVLTRYVKTEPAPG